jgi:cytochrome b6-f complex iron-sulfur subunit
VEPETTGGQPRAAGDGAPAAAGVAAPARSLAVDTPVAKPVPKRRVITRRIFILGGFWSTLMLGLVGLVGPSLDFAWPRKVLGFGGPIPVTPERIPQVGEDPVRIVEGRFWLVNLAAGITPHGEKTPGGLLAMWQKCPHLGCTVPWRSDYEFLGSKGWFRCPCHGSTYTKEGGIIVFGPAPRSLDVFPLEVQQDKSIIVQTGRAFEGTGSVENPDRAAPYQPGGKTPPIKA